jgi:hypothetical protein
MNYLTLQKKYNKELIILNKHIELFKDCGNDELELAVPTLEKQKEEVELIIKAVEAQLKK